MSSKLLGVVTAGLFLISSSGCGLKFGEKPAPSSAIEVKGGEYSCVGTIPLHLREYLEDRSSPAEISSFMLCLQKSLIKFEQLTRGGGRTEYGADELRGFLQQYFLRDHNLNDQLLHEFMVLKQVILGGRTDVITRDEIFTAVQVLEEIKTLALSLKPHLKTLRLIELSEVAPENLKQQLIGAQTALKKAIVVVSARLQKSKRSYPIANFEAFLREFRDFVDWNPSGVLVAHPTSDSEMQVWAKMWAYLVRNFKDFSVGVNESDSIAPQEWSPFLESVSSWYLAYLQFRVGIRGKAVSRTSGLDNFNHFSMEVIELLEDAIGRQKGQVLKLTQIDSVLDSFALVGWIPADFRPSSLKLALRPLVNRIFGSASIAPSRRALDSQGGGLKMQTMKNVRSEYKRWFDVQMNLDRFYMKRVLVDSDRSEWKEFLKLRSLMRPLMKDDSTRVYLVPESELAANGIAYDFDNMNRMNLMRSLVGLVMRGYAENSTPGRWDWSSLLASSELQQFYMDFRELGIDLKLADPRKDNVGRRSYIEANLFTYASGPREADGVGSSKGANDADLNMAEAIQLVTYLFSGADMSSKLAELLRERCPHLGPGDVYGRPKISRPCARLNLGDVLLTAANNIPYWQKYFSDLGVRDRARYSDELLETAHDSQNSVEGWVERAELSTLTVILQYTESMMTRYDSNGDGILTTAEIESAVPVFAGFIQTIAKEKLGRDLSPKMARAALFFVIARKKLPETKLEQLEVTRIRYFGAPRLSMDRLELLQVFRSIVEYIVHTGTPSSALVHPFSNSH